MICFVVGPSGAGKTYFSKTISEIYGIPVYDTGPILRNIYKKLRIKTNFSEWISDNEKKHGSNFAISVICKEINQQIDDEPLSIIVGNRCIEGINYLVEFLKQDYRLIYLDASYNCLKKNYETRENKIISNKEFKDRIAGGNMMGLGKLKQFVLENSNNKCFYYYKEKNESLNYIDVFNEIFEIKS